MGLRVPPASPTPGAARDRPRRRRVLSNNQFTGEFPAELCDLRICEVQTGNPYLFPESCETVNCCDLDDMDCPVEDDDFYIIYAADAAAAAGLAALAAALAGVVMLA